MKEQNTYLFFHSLVFAVLSICLIPLQTTAQVIERKTVFGITENNKLIQFQKDSPALIEKSLPITGVGSGEAIIAIDYRPCLCGLYGLSNKGNFFTIDLHSGAASLLSSTSSFTGLSGSEFDIDFEPTSTELLRITSESGSNVTALIKGNTIVPKEVQSSLSFASGDPSVGSPHVVAGAFTYEEGNAWDPKKTSYFGIDSTRDVLVRLGSPENWPVRFSTGQLFTVGTLDADFGELTGFDIGTQDGSIGLAVTTTDTALRSSLYEINLETGKARKIGDFSLPERVVDIALSLAGDIEFDSSRYDVMENAKDLTIIIRRVGGVTGAPKAEYKITGGTALPGVDFVGLGGRVIFERGVLSQEITLQVINNDQKDGNRTIELSLKNLTGGAVAGPADKTVITIHDDEVKDLGGGTEEPKSNPQATLKVKLRPLKGQTARSVVTKGLSVKVSCSESCSTNGELLVNRKTAKKLHLKVLRQASSLSLGRSKTSRLEQVSWRAPSKTFRIRLSRKAKKGVSKKNNIQGVIRFSALDNFGRVVVVKKKITLK